MALPAIPARPVSSYFHTATQVSADPPPPISGGTMIATADGTHVVAADPDRDAIYVVDVATRKLTRKIELQPKDEPARLVQDKAGRVHVALRGGRGIVSFDLTASSEVRRTAVCDLPRGLSYDAAADQLLLACAEGPVVRLDPNDGRTLKSFDLGRDVRDVVVRGDKLLVSRFRASELLEVDANDGRVLNTRRPPSTSAIEQVTVQETFELEDGVCGGSVRTGERVVTSSPTVAWRTIDVPGVGVAMLHQRASDGEVRVKTPGGYGGGAVDCAPGIVRPSITVGDDVTTSVDITGAGTFVDMAADPTGALLAVVNPSTWGTPSNVAVFNLPSKDTVGHTADVVTSSGVCLTPMSSMSTDGQATSVSWVTPWLLAVQEREPAGITFFDVRAPGNIGARLDLAQPTRFDSGHTLFHLAAGSGIACASCHAEATDDAHVWTFESIGPRRTQSIRGGILGTEPFHWNGDMRDFHMLVNEVFVERMGAPQTRPDQADALATWIDRLPTFKATVRDADAVARGEALFMSKGTACSTCHSGERLSNNEAADVGTGAFLQVPSLRAVSFRTPIMHNGCGRTIADRFTSCGGGDMHGKTSHLKQNEISDLVAYLESL